MSRYFLLLFISFSLLFAESYPQAYKQLATPLFSSSKKLQQIANIPLLHQSCVDYISEANTLLSFAKTIQNDDKNALKEYLQKLRALQTKYDYTLHKIHESINSSIDTDDYKTFFTLSSCDIEGLFKSRALLQKSLLYYEKNKKTKKIPLLEERLNFIKLLQESEEEIYNQSVRDSFNSSSKRSSNKKVYLQAEEMEEYVIIYIVNQNSYPITVEVDAWYEALKLDKEVEKIIVLQKNEKLAYMKLHKNNEPYSYKISYNWILGSKDAIHDDTYLYRLPYEKDTRVVVSQGFNGSHSHFGRNKYAVDFAMNEGSDVYAARSGVVVQTKADSNIGGRGRKFSMHGNYIKIQHNDGTFAIYYHLKLNGVNVKIGDQVKRGQIIGKSGNTGNSSGPHLHFSVFKAKDAKTTQTLPIRFLSSDGLVDGMKSGMAYKAK